MQTRVVLVSLGSILLAAGCGAGEAPDGQLSQNGTLSQGTLSQGTLSQGTLSQGTLSQGSANAVWGFHYDGWRAGDWTLVNSRVDKGRLSADWGSNDRICAA